MARCFICRTKIKYNQYKIIGSKPYCLQCADRMNNKLNEIVTPPEHVDEILRDLGISILGD